MGKLMLKTNKKMYTVLTEGNTADHCKNP
jgi:hypothetical protein